MNFCEKCYIKLAACFGRLPKQADTKVNVFEDIDTFNAKKRSKSKELDEEFANDFAEAARIHKSCPNSGESKRRQFDEE